MTTIPTKGLRVGVASRDISPLKPMFLVGYPHVPRISTGVHDPLLVSAIFFDDGKTPLLAIALDLLFVSAETVCDWRQAIEQTAGIPASRIVISATHTHSGPITAELLAWRDDPVVPAIDPDYMAFLKQRVVEAAVAARQSAVPAQLAVTAAIAERLGGNRISAVDGPSDPEAGILFARRRDNAEPLALQMIYSMHPTVMHEDSTLVSSDFPAFTRRYLEAALSGAKVIYHTGPSGNLSPRYHVKAQTFAEAERLGNLLGETVLRAVHALREEDFADDISLDAVSERVAIPSRSYPSVVCARENLQRAQADYQTLQREGAPRGQVRTAECTIFGAEEVVTLAQAEASGELEEWHRRYARAEVQVLRVGGAFLVALPGELFVEYALHIKHACQGRTFVVNLANGELQGYIVTPEAEKAGGYEAQMSMFSAAAGDILTSVAVKLIQELAT
jgi:neutral ceramidase